MGEPIKIMAEKFANLCAHEWPFKTNQAANKKPTIMKRQMFYCIDLETQTRKRVIDINEPINGTLVQESDDNFSFREVQKPNRRKCPALQWRAISRTLHLQLRYNRDHVQVIGYFRHKDYLNNLDLVDQLQTETETLGDALMDCDIHDDVKAMKEQLEQTNDDDDYV